MSLIAERIEGLVIARAATATAASTLGELVAPLARFAPAELTPAAWRDQLAEVVGALRGRGVIDDEHRLAEPSALERSVGSTSAKTWAQLSDRVLPGLGLGLAAADSKGHGRLVGRDGWAAAIVGRALGLWRDGAPPSLAQLCDALAWRELALPGKPKRCPPEIRALFVQRQLGSEAGPPERLVRLLAAREVGAPRAELRALRDALVRCWLAGRTLAPASDERAPVERTDAAVERADVAAATLRGASDAQPSSFAGDVTRAAIAVRDGRFGDRKVFVSAVWDELRTQPRWADLALDDFKARLFAAHGAGELTLARADLVAAMDPALVAASEISVSGASFHFIVQEPAT